ADLATRHPWSLANRCIMQEDMGARRMGVVPALIDLCESGAGGGKHYRRGWREGAGIAGGASRALECSKLTQRWVGSPHVPAFFMQRPAPVTRATIQEDMAVGLLERLGFPTGQSAKVIDGHHPAMLSTNGNMPKPDMLPLPNAEEGKGTHSKLNVL